MQVEQVRLDLLQVHATLDLLRGLPKNPDAPFSFLTAKAEYNWTYGQVESKGYYTVESPAGSVTVTSADENRRTPRGKNFWRGTGGSVSKLSYDGYMGKRALNETAWHQFLPFRLSLPYQAETLMKETGWSLDDAHGYMWPCGWAVCLQLNLAERVDLQELRRRVSLLRTQAVPITVGDDQASQTVLKSLAAGSAWIQNKLIRPILKQPLTQPTVSSPYMLITVHQGAPKELPKLAEMDEKTQRLIYAIASQDPSWEAFSPAKVKAGFKEIDEYAGSFIFMDRTGRFFWFPALMADARGRKTLACYTENTRSAMAVMLMLSEFVRLLSAQQTGVELKASAPLRDLYSSATKILGDFQSRYRNTNLKRLAADLDIKGVVAAAQARLS
jgi:hypothetical protein